MKYIGILFAALFTLYASVSAAPVPEDQFDNGPATAEGHTELFAYGSSRPSMATKSEPQVYTTTVIKSGSTVVQTITK